MDFNAGVNAAVKYFGSVKLLSLAIGKSRATIWVWRKNGMPVHIAKQIHNQSGGQVPLQILRPDVWEWE